MTSANDPGTPNTTQRNSSGPLETADVIRLIDEHFPGMHSSRRIVEILSVADRWARCRLTPSESNIRPGGTISGPAMFMLADFTIYVALLVTLGPPALPAVTSNLNINFLLRPDPTDLIGEASVIRIGRRLAYAEVKLMSEGSNGLVAHATGSYALGRSREVK